MPILLWNPVLKMTLALLNRCKLKPTLQGMLIFITCINFFYFYTDFTALLRKFRNIELNVKQSYAKTEIPRERKHLTFCKEVMNVVVVHVR